MVTAKLQGGMGNQLHQMSAAIGVALRNGTEAIFDLEKCSTELQGNPAHKYKDTIYRNVKSASIPIDGDSNIYKEPVFTYEPIPYSDDLIIEGYFQSDKYIADCKDYIRDLFHIEDDAKESVSDFFSSLPNKPITTLHIRRGDYMNFTDIYAVQDVEYYQKAMALFPDNNFVFVCFGQDKQWVMENFIGDNIFYTPFKEELDDLTLLTMADNSIIANSSFSWWGAFLNRKGGKVVAPQRWFMPQSNLDPKDIYCEGWEII